MRRLTSTLALAGLCVSMAGRARADVPAATPPAQQQETAPEQPSENDSDGYTPPAGTTPSVVVGGYIDVGFAHAQGDGTSFAPGDTRLPADYGVDTFASAVNSRGDVASTDSHGLFTNGFLPHSVGIGGRPSFLVNTVAADLKYTPPSTGLMVFTRVLALPRFSDAGDATHVLVEQAFGRVIPFDSQELALSVGKFDSVFGTEYLDNESNIRTGVTPSLIARYTTGQSVGAKLFYRIQLAPLWSAISINMAATNSGTFIDALQTPDVSLTGRPVGSVRLGYELNLPRVQAKLGASGMYGVRNDQSDTAARQRALGADLRVAFAGLYLNAEAVKIDEDSGGPKTNDGGAFMFASAFHARGFYGQVAYALTVDAGPLHKITPYGRYELRHAWFDGFTPISVDRITAGLRVDLWEAVIVKAEILINRELSGAPNVANNVQTTSVVYSW
ncbi:MAG TPA: hypothetical protein VH560_13685 [Polyangia bacterium]|nr:hypothetical protein [Polyangia bacterium]